MASQQSFHSLHPTVELGESSFDFLDIIRVTVDLQDILTLQEVVFGFSLPVTHHRPFSLGTQVFNRS